jgi:hypothetical protein
MPESFLSNIGIGATNELSLRVSVATLVRVLFKNPKDGEIMLALERKATLLENEGRQFVEVKVQPFGGAIRIMDSKALQDFIGNFHFDCEVSRSEQDFRIFIQPSAWRTVRQFCLQHFNHADDSILESDPTRELSEEFADALKTGLKANQFTYKGVGTIVENIPSPTENLYARDSLTARIYRIFEAHILDPSLIDTMMTNSKSYSNQDLERRAFEDFQNGGKGWSNAVLTLPLNQVSSFYLATSLENRNQPVFFQWHNLDETVGAVLEEIPVPKYQRL